MKRMRRPRPSRPLTREQQLVVDLQGAQLAQQAAVGVLEAVALVDDDIFEVVLAERLDVSHHDLKRRHDDGERVCHRAWCRGGAGVRGRQPRRGHRATTVEHKQPHGRRCEPNAYGACATSRCGPTRVCGRISGMPRDAAARAAAAGLTRGHEASAQVCALLPGAVVEHDGQAGAPALDLADPVGQHRQGAQDHEGAVDAVGAQVRQQAHGLDLGREKWVWGGRPRGGQLSRLRRRFRRRLGR